MAQPDISVIVITHNDAEHLAQAVESVLTQSHASLEVIICDDHSIDETPSVAAALCASDSRVRYHRRDRNAGSPGAPLNDGLDRAVGEYVMFLGSDDVLAPGACQALLGVARETGVDVVSGMLNRVLIAENYKRQPWFPELHVQRRVVQSIQDCPRALQDTLTTNKMYRRDFLERVGARFPDDMLYEDVVFAALTLSHAEGIAFVPDEVYEWNVYPREVRESITNQRRTEKNLADRLRALSLVEEILAGSDASVLAEFHDKVLAHHLRFYLNDFIVSENGEAAAEDEWCENVLKMIRSRIERTPSSAFRRRFLGDRALYAAALVGDVAGVRDILRGKQVGALAGRVFQEDGSAFWAPRDPNSRPTSSPLALQLSDVSGKVKSLRPHPDFSYLYEIELIESSDEGLKISGTATDPLGRLAHSGARLMLQMHTKSESVRTVSPATVTRTPKGIAWVATLPLPQRKDATDGAPRLIEMHSFNVSGEANVSQVRAGRSRGETLRGLDSAGQLDDAVWQLTGLPGEAAQFEYLGEVMPAPKRVLVIGDVSWRGRYHLGDEAMTEVALSELQDRGFEVTLVAGTPEISADLYGVPCVPAFGYANQRTREARESRLEAILRADAVGAGLTDEERSTVLAVKAADAVVIAGGGNMNSNGSHHIFERLTLTRIAHSVGVPVYVTSQTVGPALDKEDREQLREIAQYATVFGAREATTTALMRELCASTTHDLSGYGAHASIVQTLDDAILLAPSDNGDELSQRFSLPTRYSVGSFTYHAWSTGLSREEYYRALAGMLDDVVSNLDVDVVLLPHMGELGAVEQAGTENDVHGHDRIVHYSQSGRVRSLPLVSAREVLAVTQSAVLSISTRYHPVVFGAALGVPAIGVVTSYYSALRMRGALSEYGMESFAIPFEHWGTFGPRVVRAVRDGDFAAHLMQAGLRQRTYQKHWWDGIVASIEGTGEPVLVDVVDVESCEWTDPTQSELLAVARAAQEGTNMYRMNNMFTVDAHKAELKALKSSAAQTRQELDELRSENASLRGAIEEIRHRLRPPGADLRDKARRKLRSLRGK